MSTEWVTAKDLAKMFHCDPHSIVDYAKFNRYLFPRAVRKGHQYLWKLSDILRWKYKRLAAWKMPVRGIR